MNAATPISKVAQLLSDLQAKISSEGAAAKKEYEEYSDWCEERSKNLGFEIKTGKDEVAGLKVTIERSNGQGPSGRPASVGGIFKTPPSQGMLQNF